MGMLITTATIEALIVDVGRAGWSIKMQLIVAKEGGFVGKCALHSKLLNFYEKSSLNQ